MGPGYTTIGDRRQRLLRAPSLWLGAIIAGAAAVPAAAQDAAPSVAKTQIVDSLTLTKDKDLDFGQIAVTTAGTIVMTADPTPTCTVTGGLIKYGVCQAAVFEGYGQTGRTVRLKVPRNTGITITNPGGATMRITNISTNGNGLGAPITGSANGNGFRRYRIVSTDGSFEFRLAGTLNVATAQAPGAYTATIDIEIAYE